MTVDRRIEEPEDQFPIGMRVLAVDDDPTCLKLLETLLRRCQYHVTATNQARTALDMLRENTNSFDLVISDVHMPDMDGFKLLELVGLEMDLPVIMLSANSDPKLVMKGISHGACDYLLKPVRIEELKNVWQHVIRKKKVVPRKPVSNEGDRGNNNVNSGSAGAENQDQNARGTKKRKDQNDDDDNEDRDEDDDDNDENGAQKKPRVVWSVELHRKFVFAVNQLGIDKAVPKKILDLMNVEKLTRENVASHLQKYRLYLKRISCVQNQHASMAAAFGSADPSYLRVGPINSLGNFNSPLAISVPFQPHHQNQNHPSYRTFHPGNSSIGRLNSPASLGLRLPSSSGMIHMGPPNPSLEPLKFHDPTLMIENGLGIGNGSDFVSQSMKTEFCPVPSDTIDGWPNPSASSSSNGFQPSSSFQLNDRFKHGSSSLIVPDSHGWDGNNNNNNNGANPNMVMPSVSGDALNGGLVMKNGGVFHRDVDFGSMSQPTYGDPSTLVGRYDEVDKSTGMVPYGQIRQQQGSNYMMNNFGPLGDVVGSTLKQEHLKGGDFNGFS